MSVETLWTRLLQVCGQMRWSSCTCSPVVLLCVLTWLGDFFIQVCGKQRWCCLQYVCIAVALVGPSSVSVVCVVAGGCACGPVMSLSVRVASANCALKSPKMRCAVEVGVLLVMVASCFQNWSHVACGCPLCGAYAMVSCSGASVVLRVTVQSLPLCGLWSSMAGVMCGAVMMVTPVKFCWKCPF